MNRSELIDEIRRIVSDDGSGDPFLTTSERGYLALWIRWGSSHAAAKRAEVNQSVVVRALSRARRKYAELTAARGETPTLIDAVASTPPAPEPPAEVDPVALHRAKESAKVAQQQSKSLVEQLAAMQDQRDLFYSLTGAPLEPVKRVELTSGLREATAVALFSDWHVETLVRPTDTPTGNTYTLSIADLRISRAFAGVEWLTEAASERFLIRRLQLWLGGDMITNHLHPENVETAQLGPTQALLWVQHRIISGIQRLLDSDLYEGIDLVCSYGNHGRTTDKMRSSTSAHHSWEWVMYQAIAFHFRDEPRIHVLADEAAHQYTKVYDFDLHFHHGHDVKYGGGVGGIMIPINKAVSGWNRVRFCHFHNFGHFHQYLNVGGRCVNGSLIGYDPYSMSLKAEPEEPRQAFYLIDSKRGQTMKSPIWVGDPSEEARIWTRDAHMYGR